MTYVLTGVEKPLSGFGAFRAAVSALDPRMRIVMTLTYAIVVVGLSDLRVLTGAMGLSVWLLCLSGLPFRQTLKRMAMMDSFIIFMLVLLPFTMPGTPIFTIWGFAASWEGLWRAVEIALTANAVILAVMTLVGTMEPVTMGHALFALKTPARLVHLMMFTIRYIEVLREEYLRLRVSMKLRGFRPGTNWHTYRSYGYLVGMMLVRAIERSERILAAMKCRGFSGRILLLEEFRLSRSDILFALSLAVALLTLIGAEVLYATH
ncbi:cobalt ECF transporter T component CbiQ (plasmid) [Aliiroseovarius crassostreae]|uniref:cobalt ECF transporter T component CbiQ n=1 Tax=Aliiroseovarius crassostreae TaxID=154981 RepID=UPI0021AF8701|nr:cobalt ECF transporter T component CbiQ [Aliiroseovarius crassostreae]UWP93999.1 cobalt ECF transporter T component CbiQ [Aliiroseovarius crassostreae]UWQ03481.1 cobalt ECF transporter T component CbiQ [Aliiroseovarius crassostreae]UWQ06534.1 cobalt ECF transporter T component CbiQ [Aliiroseovarius crassostreae]UWQ09766.1 cobalt ECF transporter T component CbiQ [Aliiroseovarius crassostreae]UWQ12738.1 cobalt ECF transporter T component CbiQ [Aliiroseovarius crassostreae]